MNLKLLLPHNTPLLPKDNVTLADIHHPLLDVNQLAVNRQSGSMLVSVLFIIVIMSVLMVGMATLTSQSSQQFIYEVQSLKTRLVAESILEEQVFVSLNNVLATEVATLGMPRPIEGCEAYIEKSVPTGTIPIQVNITATGKCDTGQLTVNRNIEVEVIDED